MTLTAFGRGLTRYVQKHRTTTGVWYPGLVLKPNAIPGTPTGGLNDQFSDQIGDEYAFEKGKQYQLV